MGNLAAWELMLIALIFVWSGFVRSGLGFGGAALALPLLLLVENDPLVFLPIISIQLMIFSSWIAWQGYRKTRLHNEAKSRAVISIGHTLKSR